MNTVLFMLILSNLNGNNMIKYFLSTKNCLILIHNGPQLRFQTNGDPVFGGELVSVYTKVFFPHILLNCRLQRQYELVINFVYTN